MVQTEPLSPIQPMMTVTWRCLPASCWLAFVKVPNSGPMLSGQVSISWSQLALLAPLLVKWAQWQGTKAAGPLLLPAGRCKPHGQVPCRERVGVVLVTSQKRLISSSRSVWPLFRQGNIVRKKWLCGISDLCVNVCLVCFECITPNWILLMSPAGQIWGLVDFLGEVVLEEDQVIREVPEETIQCKPSRTEQRIPKAFLKGSQSGSTGLLVYSGIRD